MNRFYFYLKLVSKLGFIFLLVLTRYLVFVVSKLFQLNPFGFVYDFSFRFFSPFLFFLKRYWLFSSLFEFFFFALFLTFFLFAFFFVAVCFILPFFFPVFFFWSLMFFFRLFFFACIVGTFNYLYIFLSLVLKTARLFLHRVFLILFSFFSFFLSFVEELLLFFLFLLVFIRHFPSINSSKFLSSYRFSFFSFINSFWSVQFGSISSTRVSESIEKTDCYSIEPYFFVNLKESLVAEGLQIHEAMSDMSAPGYRRSSADSVIFLQTLKQHKIRVPDGRSPLFYSSNLALDSYVLEDFIAVEFDYRMSWIRRNLPCSVPAKYEKYIFRKYLRTGLSSIWDHYNFLASSTEIRSRFLSWSPFYAFRSLGFPSCLSSQLDKFELELGNDYHQDFFNNSEFFDEDDLEDEELLSPVSLSTGYAGFHYTQQLDDFGSFSKPYTYIAPRAERFWFKRFLTSHFFKTRSPQIDDLGYFYQTLHLVFGALSVLLLSIYFLFSYFVARLRFLFGITSSATNSFYFLFWLREVFFRFLNFILYPSQFFSSLEPFFPLKKVRFSFRAALESFFLRCFLFIFQFFSFFSFLRYFLSFFFTPFRFINFLLFCYNQNKLYDLASEELALQLAFMRRKIGIFLSFLKSIKMFN